MCKYLKSLRQQRPVHLMLNRTCVSAVKTFCSLYFDSTNRVCKHCRLLPRSLPVKFLHSIARFSTPKSLRFAMGKRGFNAKGRQVVDTIQDDTATKQIRLDLPNAVAEYGGNDASNALVLPSKKRDSKVKKPAEATNVTRILSKKKRKLLEKIVDRKKKKEGRVGLLEKLATVQVGAEQLDKYTSIINVQTKGLKKHLLEPRKVAVVKPTTDKSKVPASSVRGRALLKGYAGAEVDSDEEKAAVDYNCVGLERSDSESESEAEEEAEEAGDELEAAAVEESDTTDAPIPAESSDDESSKPVAPAAPPVIPKPVLPLRPTSYVHVARTKRIQAARLKLPICGEEQTIMEAIAENLIVILAGETGSGKTTQVPQFLYEAGYAADGKLIGITEPRRVAAISMSKRVAYEMCLGADIVSYLIRFEGNVTAETRIKFMTDGVLLREIETDFVLSKYSVIILDEAHERSIYTDILVGLLSRIVLLRHKRGDPLRLIVMSATLRVEDFTANRRLFRIAPPVLKVETRQFPVTVHFNKRTSDEYVKDAYKKALKIHNQLPEGGILIFLTGQQEVNYVVRKLRRAFPFGAAAAKKGGAGAGDEAAQQSDSESDDDADLEMRKALRKAALSRKKRNLAPVLPAINLADYKLPSDDTDADRADIEALDSDGSDAGEDDSDDDDDDNENVTGLRNTQPLWVLPLYSLLSSEKQAAVFEPPPAGSRLCVVATNVAETSLTIPNIKYVVDCGRQKARLYDKITGVSSFVVAFCSKAAANQRAGRAGRTAPGHCYRLYSSAVFNDEFADFARPDIQCKPVDHLMLQMKCMGIDRVVNFPFPSPPDRDQLEVAEAKLRLLGALSVAPADNDKSETKVTALGQAISAFPVAPRFGKMLALSHQQQLLPYTVCMVAALSVQEVLQEAQPAAGGGEDEAVPPAAGNARWSAKRRAWAGTGNSLLLGDPMVLLRAVGAAEFAGSQGRLEEFCAANGLRPKAIAEIRKLRVQLTNDINMSMPEVALAVDPQMAPPTDVQAKLLRQILLAGMGDQVARRVPEDEAKDAEERRKLRYAYRCPDMEEPVYLHGAAVLRKSKPEWVVYQEIYELQNGDSRKMFMRGVSAVEPEWLVTYVPALCNVRAIKEEPLPPTYNQRDGRIYCYVDATFGRSGWEIPLAQIEMPFGELACKYFAMFFLSGEVFSGVLRHAKEYRSTPKHILKSWSSSTVHVVAFVNRLLRARVYSRQHLLDRWRKEPNFLLAEFREYLIPQKSTEEPRTIDWPPA